MIIRSEMQVCGFFQLATGKLDENGNEIEGSYQIKAPWFPNLITNAGLERMGASGFWKEHCQVGSGSATPQFTDTGLASRIASTITTLSSDTGVVAAEGQWYGWSRATKRFGQGVAAGNISEIGMGWAATESLFSRALVLDTGGAPTTIQVLPDEYLDVSYETRQYLPMSDGVSGFNIEGVDYVCTTRAANGTSAQYWSNTESGSSMSIGEAASAVAYSGGLGSISGGPSGVSAVIGIQDVAYAAGTLERKAVISAAPSQGNIEGGIGSILLYGRPTGSYQIGFSPKLPKTSAKSLSMTVSRSWARKTL